MTGEGASDAGERSRPSPVRPCPICGRAASAETLPFCSKRCADVDLNRWLSGVYAIPAREDPEEEDSAAEM